VLLRRALTPRVFSHVRLRESGVKDSIVFDATLYDENGEEIASVESFTMRKAAPRFSVSAPANRVSTAVVPRTKARPETATESAIREGMTPGEGLEALDRVLALDFAPQVVVCTVPLQPWLAQLEEEARGSAGRQSESGAVAAGPMFSRPSGGATFAAPRNYIERDLAALWSGLLGVAEVGVHDDFFELGGYSLIAVRLLSKIKKTFGVDLALESLFRAPTIAGFAQLVADELGIDLDAAEAASACLAEPTAISDPDAQRKAAPAPRTAGSRAEWSPLVPIQVKGSKLPFFVVHGAGGNVLNLRDLSRRLGDDQPFYGLQAQGVDGKLRPLRRIEGMAAQYLEAIRQVRPHGPYMLGGYSGGGVVAYEMAQRLQAEGEEVRFLGFLDTFCPVLPRHPSAFDGDTRTPERLRRARHDLSRAWHWRPSWWPGFDFAAKRARIWWRTRHGEPVPHDLREFALYDSFLVAQANYKPKPYSGSVTLLVAKKMDPAFTWVGSDLGWAPYVAGGLEIHQIPGTHQTLVLEPSVQLLLTDLRAALDGAGMGSLDVAA
jgi:thioesterase domain-containing protein/acyl carrier protein